jgi:hypothetical protein
MSTVKAKLWTLFSVGSLLTVIALVVKGISSNGTTGMGDKAKTTGTGTISDPIKTKSDAATNLSTCMEVLAGNGKKILKCTGKGGADDGLEAYGSQLPDNVSSLKMPFTVVVKPNEIVMDKFRVGENITIASAKGNTMVSWADASTKKNYVIDYSELKAKTLKVNL